MNNVLNYSSTQDRKGVLGKLEGVCADTIKSTRNGRRYSETLWEKVFKDPIIKEYFDCGGIFGELGHPADREETDMEKIAICMPCPPERGSDGKLRGKWDILDTPNGRILKCLCDYGYKIGISSRGSGDTYKEFDGQESVDPDTYHLEAFDAVLLPAVKDARLSLVEGMDTDKINFKRALNESLEKSSDDERKIMQNTLEDLGIDYKSEECEKENESLENPESSEAENIGDELVESLQESLKENKKLKKQILDLQEKLSVSYTKEIENTATISNLNSQMKDLNESLASMDVLREKVNSLTLKLKEERKSSYKRNKMIESYRKNLTNSSIARKNTIDALIESKSANAQLVENFNKIKDAQKVKNEAYDSKLDELKSQVSSLETESRLMSENYSRKLKKAQEMISTQSKACHEAMKRYIKLQASTIGVQPESILEKLDENYSLDDVDTLCESFAKKQRKLGSLPFILENFTPSKVVSKNNNGVMTSSNPDDIVDSSLATLI